MKVTFKVINKCLTGYKVKNLTEYSHISPYGIYGVIKNQIITGFGVVKNDTLYVTWDVGGCTMLSYNHAIELGFEIETT